jgi:hypothetical protein
MADKSNSYKHDASDKALDRSAAEASSARDETASHASGPSHDPAEIRKHDDAGKDRLFEGRQQHDEAEKNSEKTRLAKDVARHDHPTDDDVADSGSGASAKRKS